MTFMATFEGGIRGISFPVKFVFMPWNNNEKDQKLIYPTEFRLKTKFEFYGFYGFFFGFYAMALFSRLYGTSIDNRTTMTLLDSLMGRIDRIIVHDGNSQNFHELI